MANHKRKRPKHRRAGCLLCKPHKAQGNHAHARARGGDMKRLRATDDDLKRAKGGLD